MSEPGGSIGRSREEVLADGLATAVRFLRARQKSAACDPDAVIGDDGICHCPRCEPLNNAIMQGEAALLYQEEINHA